MNLLFSFFLLSTEAVGKGVCSAPISTPKNIKQHNNPTKKDTKAEKDLLPNLERVALHPFFCICD